MIIKLSGNKGGGAGAATGSQVNTSKVKASATDTTEGYLGDKLVAGTNVTITKNNSGANETYTIASTGVEGSGVTVYADLATLKAVDTTAYADVRTVQVTSLGLYKFQPGSTLTADDDKIIRPTTGSGRWIKQSINVSPVYKFYQADSGALGFVCESDRKGALIVGGAGSFGSGENLALATCDELKTLGKVIRFSIRDASYRPSLFIAANGSYTSKGSNFKALGLQFSSTLVKVIKHSGSTATLVKTFNFGSPASGDNQGINITVKHKGNRIEITVIDECRNVVVLNSFYIDSDLSSSGEMYGFTNSWGDVSVISNICISDFAGFGSNIILGGDSQQSEAYTIAGESITNKLARFMINHNSFFQNTSVIGRYFQQAIDGFATEVLPRYEPASANNIYSINLGTNDVRSSDPLVKTSTAMLARLNSLVTLAKNAGFKVSVCTVPVYNLTASQKVELTAFNNGIRALKSAGTIDYLVDLFDEKYNIVDQATGTLFRNLLFPDNLHWNNNCREKVAYAMFDVLKQSTSVYMTDENSGDGSFLGLTKSQITQIAKIDQTFTAAQNTKLNAINAVGTAVASAATITVPANKTIFHVTGTTAISTINLPYAGFVGKISIIADGAFTFDTAGNIAEAYTATISRAIELVFDGAKWYRV
jgi:hypothetical protein